MIKIYRASENIPAGSDVMTHGNAYRGGEQWIKPHDGSDSPVMFRTKRYIAAQEDVRLLQTVDGWQDIGWTGTR